MVSYYRVVTGKWGVAAQIWRSVNRHIRLIEVWISDVSLYFSAVTVDETGKVFWLGDDELYEVAGT